MTEKLLNLIKQHSENITNARMFVKFGLIYNYDPVRFIARVNIQPEGVISGWLKISSSFTNIFTAPNVGDICQIIYAEGDINGGVINLFMGKDKPSIPVNSSDILIEKINIYTLIATSLHLFSTKECEISASGDMTLYSSLIFYLTASDIEILSTGQISFSAKSVELMKMGDEVQFMHGEVGSGMPLLSNNCPATDLSKPYTWIKIMSADDTVCYIPSWR
jgi:hypothetical protein